MLPPLLPRCSLDYLGWQLLNQRFLFYIFFLFAPVSPPFPARRLQLFCGLCVCVCVFSPLIDRASTKPSSLCCCCCCCFSHSAYWLQPEKTTLHGGQSRSWSAEQGKENKIKSLAAYPPPTPTPHIARSEKINKITRRINRRYAGLGRSRVRTRIPSARRLHQWVWLRKILHSRLR